MKIGGLKKISLIDFPEKIAAVIFTQGCNFRCPWCHNPELVCPELFEPVLDSEGVLEFLNHRRHQLEGIVLTGGEPLMQPALKDYIKRIRDMGFRIKLDTNGTFPERLKELLDEGLIDFVAMDVKAPFSKYDLLAGIPVDIHDIRQTINIIKHYAPDYEFRTTSIKKFLDKNDLIDIIHMIEPCRKYVVQRFALHKTIGDSADYAVHTDEEFHEKKLFLRSYDFKTEIFFR